MADHLPTSLSYHIGTVILDDDSKVHWLALSDTGSDAPDVLPAQDIKVELVRASVSDPAHGFILCLTSKDGAPFEVGTMDAPLPIELLRQKGGLDLLHIGREHGENGAQRLHLDALGV